MAEDLESGYRSEAQYYDKDARTDERSEIARFYRAN